MFQPNNCRIILGVDAISDFEKILTKLSQKSYIANLSAEERIGQYDFIQLPEGILYPEIHVPVQLLNFATHYKTQMQTNKLRKILIDKAFERAATQYGDIRINLERPLVHIIFDKDHGIVNWNENFHGHQFVADQLLLGYANWLSELQMFKHESADFAAHNKSNVIVATNSPTTTLLALAEGFSVWDYDSTNCNNLSLDGILIENEFIEDPLMEESNQKTTKISEFIIETH